MHNGNKQSTYPEVVVHGHPPGTARDDDTAGRPGDASSSCSSKAGIGPRGGGDSKSSLVGSVASTKRPLLPHGCSGCRLLGLDGPLPPGPGQVGLLLLEEPELELLLGRAVAAAPPIGDDGGIAARFAAPSSSGGTSIVGGGGGTARAIDLSQPQSLELELWLLLLLLQ